MKRVIFITGTDTGVGKTVVTALLLLHLRQNKVNAIAMKPFCSGSRNDVRLIQSCQRGDVSDNAVNPYFYDKPLAPFAAQPKRRGLRLRDILSKIAIIGERADVLLVEGAGGVLVPISASLCMIDLMRALSCEVILVARNQLGTLNHTLLSVNALKQRGFSHIKIILVEPAKRDPSSGSNARILTTLLPDIAIFSIPFSLQKLNKHGALQAFAKKTNKTLARMMVHP